MKVEQLPAIYNQIEVILWAALAVVCGVMAQRRTPHRRRLAIAAVTLAAFALSDWVEARTGNQWWHPWWLLAWKAACVTILAATGLFSRGRASASRRS